MASMDWSTLLEAAAAEGFSNEILPDGPYEVRVESAQVGNSKQGKPQIGIRLRITSGPNANKSVWDNLTVTTDNPKAMAVFFRKCNAYGAGPELFSRGAGLDEIAAAMVGRTGTVQLGHREWNDNTYQQVNSFKADADVPGVPSAPAAPFVPAAPTLVPPTVVPQATSF